LCGGLSDCAAGFLKGLAATSHPTAFKALRPYCAGIDDRRIVDEGGVVTVRGPTASIDTGAASGGDARWSGSAGDDPESDGLLTNKFIGIDMMLYICNNKQCEFGTRETGA
jgi:hypothetical protein